MKINTEAYNILAGMLCVIGNYPKTMEKRQITGPIVENLIKSGVSFNYDQWFVNTNPKLTRTVSASDIHPADLQRIDRLLSMMLVIKDEWKIKILCEQCKELVKNIDEKILHWIWLSSPNIET